MSDPSNDELDYLLSRGALSGEKRDEILRNVLASTAARTAPARRRWWAWGGGTGLVLAAGAAALLLWARGGGQAEEFRAKGASQGTPMIGISCLGAAIKACPRGSLLGFTLDGAPAGGTFVSAYADPVPAGERIWYFTNQPVEAGMVPKAARVGDEHTAARYRIHVLVSRSALSRADLLAAGADVVVRAHYDLEVVP